METTSEKKQAHLRDDMRRSWSPSREPELWRTEKIKPHTPSCVHHVSIMCPSYSHDICWTTYLSSWSCELAKRINNGHLMVTWMETWQKQLINTELKTFCVKQTHKRSFRMDTTVPETRLIISSFVCEEHVPGYEPPTRRRFLTSSSRLVNATRQYLTVMTNTN